MNLFLPCFWKRNVSLFSQLSSAMKIALLSIRSTGSCMPLHGVKIADCVSERQQEISRVRCPEISYESMARRKQETCSMNVFRDSFVFPKCSTMELKMGNENEKRREVVRGGVSLFQVGYRSPTGAFQVGYRSPTGAFQVGYGSCLLQSV